MQWELLYPLHDLNELVCCRQVNNVFLNVRSNQILLSLCLKKHLWENRENFQVPGDLVWADDCSPRLVWLAELVNDFPGGGEASEPFVHEVFLIHVGQKCSWYAQSRRSGIMELEANYKMMDVAGTLILFGLASWPQRALHIALRVTWTLFRRFLGWVINRAGLRVWRVHMECGRCAREGVRGHALLPPSSRGELTITVTNKPCSFPTGLFKILLMFPGWLK